MFFKDEFERAIIPEKGEKNRKDTEKEEEGGGGASTCLHSIADGVYKSHVSGLRKYRSTASEEARRKYLLYVLKETARWNIQGSTSA